MNIDWVVAIGLFLLFVLWGFAFYGQLFTVEQEDVGEALELISEKVLDNLTVTIHSVPLKANVSNVSETDKVLFFEFRWAFGKNTTQILKGGNNQSCNITGNTIYWQSGLEANVNYFTMRYSEQEVPLRCTGGFSVVNETQVVPFAIEEQEQISLARINNMNDTNYSVFKNQLGITRDFNITISNATSTLVSYGILPPRQSNVFSKRVLGKLEETEENITIRFLTW